MTKLIIKKSAAVQRQVDAAIRIMFTGEDHLAVHTLAAAAHRVVMDLAEKRGVEVQDWEHIIRRMYEELSEQNFPDPNEIKSQVPEWKRWFQNTERKPSNFLKHADRDPDNSLDATELYGETDLMLLEAVVAFQMLGLKWTPEMTAFWSWYCAVYPHDTKNQMETMVGLVHQLDREHQLELGEFILSKCREHG